MQSQSLPILITGIGKRIGFALCQHFLSKGIPVIGTYRSRYPSFEAIADADLIHCDFYKHDNIEELVTKIKAQYSGLKAIIHNASDWVPESRETPSDEVFAKMMQIHAAVPYQLNLALAELLQNNNSTSDIIHITDYVAEKGSQKHIAYAASKAALSNMTLSFSALLAPKVKVNAIAPSLIMFNPEDDEAYKRKAIDKSLMKLTPGAEEIITAVEYLQNSQYITGRTLSVDGGRHIR